MVTAGEGTQDDDIDPGLGERYYGGSRAIEEKLADEIGEVIQAFISRRFDEGRRPALRDAHAGDTGCVRASFTVDADLDPALRCGVFVPGAQYKAWIRFSNGNSERLSARLPDARGMAIKLVGVPGPKLLDDETGTQDFLLANTPVFFVDDLGRYRDTLKKFHSGGYLQQFPAVLQLKGREILLALMNSASIIVNPLFCRYWSMTAFRLGVGPDRTAMKFMVKPRAPSPPPLPQRVLAYFSPSFSQKTELQRVLADRDAEFDFYVQRFVDGERTPIEDSKVEWDETVARPEHVARIVIPAQRLISPERDRFCENLSFTPWHCVPEYKPLGAVNRVRKRIYRQISTLRRGLNNVTPQEPTGDEAI